MKFWKVNLGCIVGMLLACSQQAHALDKTARGKGQNGVVLTQTYTWFDGDRERTVWLNPQAVAEFGPAVAGASAVQKVNAGATEWPMRRPQSGIRVWKMDNTNNAAIKSVRAAYPAGKYSPVFHNGPSTSSAMLSLPGNVVVMLNPAWKEAEVQAWFSKHALQVVRRMHAGANIFLIQADSGLASLEKANALYQSGEVSAAFPDWWQEVEAK